MRQRPAFSPRIRMLTGISLLAVSFAGCEAVLSTDVPSAETVAGSGALPSEPMTPEPPASLRVSSEDVDTVMQSNVSGLAESRRSVIRSAEAWDETWSQVMSLVQPTPAAPELDFSAQQVVVVAMGEKLSGGYSIGVDQIAQDGDTVFVWVLETSPGPDCLTTQAMVQPVMGVSMPLIDAPVVFVEEVAIQNCS